MLTRRQFIKAGMIGGAGLALVRILYGPFSSGPMFDRDQDYRYQFLNPKQRTLIAALAPVMLDGALPREASARDQAVIQVMRGVDVAVAGLPPNTQEEIQQLFALLVFPMSRRWVARVSNDWLTTSTEEITDFLQRWRFSSFALMRSAYQALHQLIIAAWYGNDQSWSLIGYAGPPTVR